MCRTFACFPWSPPPAVPAMSRRGLTLVELLVATTLTMMMMAFVVLIFGTVSRSIGDSRAALEMSDRVRVAAARLQRDLEGATVTMAPPRDPGDDEGYFEIIEGPIGPEWRPDQVGFDFDTGRDDTTIGDFDDVLLFTTRSSGRPFIGMYQGQVVESPVAEVAWFVRGRTLYRRVLLVRPDLRFNHLAPDGAESPVGYYGRNDISARLTGAGVIANSLGDLTKRENRFGRWVPQWNTFPFDARQWGQFGLPTLMEQSHDDWSLGVMPAGGSDYLFYGPDQPIDLWATPRPRLGDEDFSLMPQLPPLVDEDAFGPRSGEDVILNHVIGFDVKVWDPGAPLLAGAEGTALVPGDPGYPSAAESAYLNDATNHVGYGAYVDLGYARYYVPPQGTPAPLFHRDNYDPPEGQPGPRSFLSRTYCTWSTHYETHEPFLTQFPPFENRPPGWHGDGFDNTGSGMIDDDSERLTRPPYPVPLRGVQVKVRVYEPSSRQIREVTVVQDFVAR